MARSISGCVSPLGIACLLLQLMSLAQPMSAASMVRVSASGDEEYRSIQCAIDAVDVGGTVEVTAGIYRENIVIAKPLTLRGAGMGQTTIELPGDVGPTLEGYWERQLESLEKLTLKELSVPNAPWRKKLSSIPFVIRGDNQVTVEGLQLLWVGPKSIKPPVTPCLLDISEADVDIRNAAFLASPDDAIHIRAGASCDMTDCLIAGNWSRGVKIGANDEPPGKVRIANCEIRNNYNSHIIIFNNAKDVRIEGNLLHGSAWFGIRPNSNSLISGNAIFDNARSALYSSGASTVTGNLIFGNGFGGISCWPGNRDSIVGNTFVDSGRDSNCGITCIGDAQPIIRDNIFFGHPVAIQATFSNRGDRQMMAESKPEIGRNLYWKNTNNVVRVEPIRNQEEGVVESIVRLEPKNLAEFDPGFRNVAKRDFSLREDSRARQEKLGAQVVLDLHSRFPLHAVEMAMIPEGDQWDFHLWKKPPKPDGATYERRLVAIFESKQSEALRPDVSYAEALRDLHSRLGERYPNFEWKGIDWQAIGEELIPRAEQLDSDREFGLLCYELVARLKDSHASVRKGLISPPLLESPRWDPGLACMSDDRGKPVIYYIDQGGPAAAAGMKKGMTIVSINGRPADELRRELMAKMQRYVGYSSERYLRYQAVRWFVRQFEKDASMAIVAEDVNGEVRTFDVKATMDVRYLPRRPVKLEGIHDAANVDWTMLADGIGLIYVRRIRGDLLAQLDKAVTELQAADGLIIDVRGNSGGGFDFQRAHLNFTDDLTREPDRPRYTGSIALLLDSRCISAGEGWASWFIANKRARAFGTATAGSSARKSTYELRNKLFKVTFPIKPYKGYLDRIIECRGLEPDEEVRQSAGDLAEGKDTVLEAAIDWLRSVKPQ